MHLGLLSKKETESPYFSRKQGSSKNEFNAIKLINNFNVICCFSRTLISKLLLLFCKMKVPHQDQQCKMYRYTFAQYSWCYRNEFAKCICLLSSFSLLKNNCLTKF